MLQGWCYRCECAESTSRVEYSEARGAFASERWVQELCEACTSDKVAALGVSSSVWDVVVRSI